MSNHCIEITASGASNNTAPSDAIREAVSQCMGELGRAGASPFHLTELTLKTNSPASFNPSRREIDLAFREVVLGARPLTRVVYAPTPGLTVTATACITPITHDAVYKGMSPARLASEYTLRAQVSDINQLFADWRRSGAVFLESQQGRDIFYGPGRNDRFDLYRPADAERPPVWIFVHGGYWQSMAKESNAHFMAGMLEAGFAVANLEYTLAPDLSLQEIVDQVRSAVAFIARNVDELGVDGSSLNLAGHSAGAHLAAMIASDLDGPAIQSALLISGLFDLEPIALLPMARVLGLNATNVGALSPLLRTPQPETRFGVVVGGREPNEFKRQSRDLTIAWGLVEPHIFADKNHFDIADGLNGGELYDQALALARPKRPSPAVHMS
jgi:arylformamidase